MRSLRSALGRLEAATAMLLLVGLLVSVLVQVVARYLFDAPLAGIDELARFTLVWLTFVGAALVAGSKDGHIAADFIRAKLPEKALLVYDGVRRLLVLVTCMFMSYATFEAIGYAGSRSSTSLGFAMSWWYYAPMCAFALVAVHQLITPLKQRLSPREEGTGAS